MAIPRVSGDFMEPIDLAYIAGFLDGDGCIMLQLIRRKDYVYGYQLRASIVFYQKSESRPFLEGLKAQFQKGYVRDRNDGISEYTIVGLDDVEQALNALLPFLRLKRARALLALQIISRTPRRGKELTPKLLIELAQEVDKFSSLNYSKKRKVTSSTVEQFLQSL